MSAILDEFHTLIAKLEEEEHALAQRFRDAFDALKADAPKLGDEAKSDAEDVAHTAATEGIVPAEHEAEGDAVKLAQDAVHDVADALAGSSKPAETDPAHTTAQTAAVIAGEAAVAAEQGA